MFSYLFTFRSLTAAQSGRNDLYRAGIETRIQRAPQEVSSLGCAWAVRVPAADGLRAAALLRAAEHPLRMQEMQPIARVNGYGESAIEYVLFLWIRPKDYMDVYYDVLENVKREFDAAGIEMTYPHINVHHIS